MVALIAGGGSGAVASSAHAGCTRFRMTDPMLLGRSRRALAAGLGMPDTGAGIPAARWVRAMAFERMVHDEAFVSELLTRAVGLLGLARPQAVRIRSGKDSVSTTAAELAAADLTARHAGEATMLFGLRLPFLNLEHEPGATDVRPDFAIVAGRPTETGPAGSWLVVGDAKDYERVRSRIDDGRMLKGFLQVALGAESAAAWSRLPRAMQVHRFGVLAVPRNAYLRPEAIVEDLADHRAEVKARVAERIGAMRALDVVPVSADELRRHVEHVEATFDPATCPTCSLFRYCRQELRTSGDPRAVLVEIGVRPAERAAVAGLVDATGVAPPPSTAASLIAAVEATTSGRAVPTGRRRIDPVGQPGCINVVVVKSDAAALGVHGIALQRVTASGVSAWERRIFARTNATETRHAAMGLIGAAVRETLESGEGPLHLVVPDQASADLLVSIADSLAGVELSRLRWERDLEQGRDVLTFDGEPAVLPAALGADARTAVSLLLEEDRARAFGLRQPVVDLRAVLTTYVTVGGPRSDAGRLDYLVEWVTAGAPLDHRVVSDDITDREHTPGARLSTALSDEIHDAGRPERGDAAHYERRVGEALDYRIRTLERAVGFLQTLPISRLQAAYRGLELDSQVVWGRRHTLQASDLVRFSRTYRYWRNAQVDMLDKDRKCRDQLAALVDQTIARDRAADAGVRDLTLATVVGVDPVRLAPGSRRFGDGIEAVMLHGPGGPVVDGDIDLTVQAGGFKLGRMPVARLDATDDTEPGLLWTPDHAPALAVGDVIVLADAEWFGGVYRSGHEIAVGRPSVDGLAAPRQACAVDSYATDPAGHQWCCRPHVAAEAEWSDTLAERRARGELNPEVWPPVVDEERFDPATGEDLTESIDPPLVPEGWTLDDID